MRFSIHRLIRRCCDAVTLAAPTIVLTGIALVILYVYSSAAAGDAGVSNTPATAEEIAERVHGIGPVLSNRLLEHYVVYERLAAPSTNFGVQLKLGWINPAQHGAWRGDDAAAVQWLMGELDKYAEWGLHGAFINGPTSHVVSPATGEGWNSLSDNRKAMLQSLLPRWKQSNPDFYLIAYLRPKSGNWHQLPRPWNPSVPEQLANWQAETDGLIELGFDAIGIDSSSSYEWLPDLAELYTERGIEIMQEGPGAFDEPNPTVSRMAMVRLIYNRTVHSGQPLPQVLPGERWYAVMAAHGVAGGDTPAWEAMGITRAELAQMLRGKGWSIVSADRDDHTDTAVDAEAQLGLFRAVSWAEPAEGVVNTVPMIWVKDDSDPEILAEISKARPDGMAALFIWQTPGQIFNNDADNCLEGGEPGLLRSMWFDQGIADVRLHYDQWFAKYHKVGGRCEWLVIDFEGGRTIWHFAPEDRLAAINCSLNDPRSALLLDQLAERGLDNPQAMDIINTLPPAYNLGDDFSLVFGLSRPSYAIWNGVAEERTGAALDAALVEPVRFFFPDVQSSNYRHRHLSIDNLVPDSNGHLQAQFYNVGTHNAKSFYGNIGNFRNRKQLDGSVYGTSPFSVLRWHINYQRAVSRSADVPLHAWVSHKNWPGGVFTNSLYYDELIYHLGLNGVTDFIYWNPNAWRADQDPRDWRTDEADLLFDSLLTDLNERLLVASAPATSELMDWNSDLIVSGSGRSDGTVVWRITTPSLDTKVVELTTGTLLRDDGSVGFWFISNNDLTPVFVIPDDLQ